MFLGEFLKTLAMATYWSALIVLGTMVFSAVCIAICLFLCLLGIWNWAGLMLGAALLPWVIYLLVVATLHLLDWADYTWCTWRLRRLNANEAKK